MNRIALRLSLSLAAVLAAGAARAATESAQFTVTATVVKTCRISADATVPVGNYDPFATTDATSGAGTVTVTCTKGGGYTLTIDKGSNEGGTGARRMTDGTEFLAYELYSDVGATAAWSAPLTVIAATGMAGDDHVVVAKVPAGQDVSVGSYSDTVTATVDF
jgi:spore coat protein U-like protein